MRTIVRILRNSFLLGNITEEYINLKYSENKISEIEKIYILTGE